MSKYVKFSDTGLKDLQAATPANLAKPAKPEPTLATLAALAGGDSRELEDWFSDFAERYAINKGNGMAEEDAQKDALVYTLKYALRHFAETGEL